MPCQGSMEVQNDLRSHEQVDTTSITNVSLLNQVTRSHKFNDRDHAGLADGSASPEEHQPRYFSKSGHEGVDPKKVKKEGSGKSNWYPSLDPVSITK